jgi:putative N-acetylmannosamine-6-phosphate epimerase
MLRAKTTADINAINKQFANDVFGIVEKSKTDKESKMAALINSVTQL